MQLIAVALHSSTGASNLPPGNLELLFLRQHMMSLKPATARMMVKQATVQTWTKPLTDDNSAKQK